MDALESKNVIAARHSFSRLRGALISMKRFLNPEKRSLLEKVISGYDSVSTCVRYCRCNRGTKLFLDGLAYRIRSELRPSRVEVIAPENYYPPPAAPVAEKPPLPPPPEGVLPGQPIGEAKRQLKLEKLVEDWEREHEAFVNGLLRAGADVEALAEKACTALQRIAKQLTGKGESKKAQLLEQYAELYQNLARKVNRGADRSRIRQQAQVVFKDVKKELSHEHGD
jgi:hypothetical protein